MKGVTLIFGVSGFIGKNFCRYRLKYMPQESYKLVGVTSKALHEPYLGVDYLEVIDSFDTRTICNLIKKYDPEYILNFIGVFGDASFKDLIYANVEIPQIILQSVVDNEKLNIRLLFIGSAAEYGMVEFNPVSEDASLKPITPYGLSKMFQSELVRFYYERYNVQSVLARTFNLIGPNISTALSIGSFQSQINAACDGDVINTGNLDSVRDFVDIEIAIEMYVTLLHYGVAGEVYNVCSGTPCRVGDLLESMISDSGKRLTIKTSLKRSFRTDVPQIYGSLDKFNFLLNSIPLV